jgi:hypothetical protein
MTDLTLKIYFRNAACQCEKTQAIETALAERVIQLSGGVEEAKAYWDAPDRLTNPLSHFNRYFNTAVFEVLDQADYSPSARHQAKFTAVWLGPDGKAV